MSVGVKIFTRGGALVRYEPSLTIRAVNYSRHIRGGARAAELEAVGDGRAVNTLLDWLRYGVEIISGDGARGDTVWAGYINEIKLAIGALNVGISIDAMSNSVRVGYMVRDSAGGQNRRTTAAVVDSESVATYGTKELLAMLATATDAQATGAAATLLDAIKNALPVWDGFGELSDDDSDTVKATIYCLGWWQSFDWKYYSNAIAVVSEKYNAEPEDFTYNIGDTSATAQYTVQFQFTGTLAHHATRVRLKLVKIGAPADALRISIYADAGAGVPGALLCTADIPASSITTEHAWQDIDLTSSGLMYGATAYLIHVQRTSAIDAVNFYRMACNSAAGYASGATYKWSGAAWVVQANDTLFQVDFEPVTELTSFISDVYTAANQFFSGLQIETTTTIYTPRYRSGDQTALAVLNELLDTTDQAGARLAIEITPEKWVRVYSEPANNSASDVYFSRDGAITSKMNVKMAKDVCTVGVWAHLRDSPLATAYDVFIEESEYVTESDRYNPKARSQRSVFDALNLRIG